MWYNSLGRNIRSLHPVLQNIVKKMLTILKTFKKIVSDAVNFFPTRVSPYLAIGENQKSIGGLVSAINSVPWTNEVGFVNN